MSDEFIAAGLYDPEVDSGTGRLDLLQWLVGKGFTIDEMVAAFDAGVLGALAGDHRLVPGERLTRAEARRLADVAPEEFDAGVTAFGFRPIAGAPPGEVGITSDEARAIAWFDGLGTMFSPEEAVSFLRVVGASTERIAEAAVSLFLLDVESRLLVAGVSELELAQRVEEATGLIDGFAERLDPILRRQVLQAIDRSRRTMIDMVERFRYRYAVGFVDLVGFTAVSGDMDVTTLSAFLRDFEGRAYDVATAAGARVAKLIGDEVMFVAADPAAACVAARELMRGVVCGDDRVVPRGGVAYGEVLVRGGDYYGPVVNLASRLVDEAVPGEVLVTDELAVAAPSCRFEAAGRRMVKGFANPVKVCSLVALPPGSTRSDEGEVGAGDREGVRDRDG